MNEHDRLRASGLTIRTQQNPQAAYQRICGWQRVRCRAGWTDRCALATTSANIGVDRDVIAGRHNRTGGTEIETAIAADDLRARMRADIFGESNVARLVEIADKIARLQYRLEYRGRIVGISTQIT